MESGSLSFEKRKHPRIRITLPVEFKVINENDAAYQTLEIEFHQQEGNSKNISSEGLFLVSDRYLEKGDILKIEMTLPDDEKQVRAFAEIVWVSDHGLAEGKHGAGLFFMALRDEDADRIGRLVANMLKTT